jgi:hypothetical protein
MMRKIPIAERVELQEVNNPARNLAERQLASVGQTAVPNGFIKLRSV